MPDDAGLDQMMRQHRHCEPGGAADLNRVRIGRANAEMLGEDRRQHDVRRDGGIAAEHAVDLCSRQSGIGNRKLGGLAHEVEGGRTLMPTECRQSDAGDEAHGSEASCNFVIPGRSKATSPESITTIVRMDSGPAPRGASRNDEVELLAFISRNTLIRLRQAEHLLGPSLFFFSQQASSKPAQIFATTSRIDFWLADSAKSMR